MDRIIFGTPLPFSLASKDYAFASGLTIRSIRPILWELSAGKGYMSDAERKRMDGAAHWLCVSQEVESWHSVQPGDDFYEKVRRGMYALQIICPSGATNQYFKFCETPEGFDNIGSWQPVKMTSTMMGRLAELDGQKLNAEFDLVFGGGPRGSVENRPTGVTSKPANGVAQDLVLIYPASIGQASLFWFSSSAVRT